MGILCVRVLAVCAHRHVCPRPCVRSPKLHRVSYQVSSRPMLEEALDALTDMKELRQLELVVKNFMLCADQLRTIGEAGGARALNACWVKERGACLALFASSASLDESHAGWVMPGAHQRFWTCLEGQALSE